MDKKIEKIWKLRIIDRLGWEQVSPPGGQHSSEREAMEAARKILSESNFIDKVYIVKPDGTQYLYEREAGEIMERHIRKCEKCGKYTGYAIERYNGCVPVWCKCQLLDKENYDWELNNPCMMALNKYRLIWRPTSDAVDKDGVLRHNPAFNCQSVW